MIPRDPTWHVSSRSGVATLRTAIHLLLTYLLIHLTVIILAVVLFLYRPVCLAGVLLQYESSSHEIA